jgi:hypothetical protein
LIYFFGSIYIFLTFLPNLGPNCPYRTPFNRDTLKWFFVVPTVPVLLGVYFSPCLLCSEMLERVHMRFLFFVQSLLWTMSDATRSLQGALQWAVATIDDDDIEIFLEGIPGYLTNGRNVTFSRGGLRSSVTQTAGTPYQLTCPNMHPEGYRGAAENVRRHRALICLDTARVFTEVYYASFSYGYPTWPSAHSLKRDDDPVIAINAISTGPLAPRGYLCSVVFVEGAQQSSTTAVNHAQKLFKFDNAQDRLYSYVGCHLLVLQGFISALPPHLSSEEALSAAWTSSEQIPTRQYCG